ncbi:hypothetical protein CERSUDRAFT_82440 [Gelatoporia subvermispora B]|uniref:BTB domain-containing protein n=1 Tax=Ceriporiopsis subvermispora (strain B) TaxID=914234 RepID=M2R100_CERS8|nr:hypothetical protein CERSUDRAFT_82440 [Gelatoporia subvermispora B]
MHTVAFVPRPFPPPALADVPLEYIIHQLRRLAPHYWSKPETSDCTIVVPLDSASTATSGRCSRPYSISAAPADAPVWASTEPTRMVMKVHMDYLCAHSALLRGLLGGASPFDLLSALSGGSRPRTPASAPPPSKLITPPPPLPCLLPSPPTRPTIYLPVPDPKSLRMLVHFIYFGATSYIEDALDAGELTWDGLARNIEYLGMGSEIRACLGQWYARRRRLLRSRAVTDSDSASESDTDTDVSSWESDDEDMETASTAVTLVETDSESDEELPMDVTTAAECPARVDPPRGRTRTQRRLGHSTSDPTFGRPRPSHSTPEGSRPARRHSED